jgi:RNA recognition motif-containing protein
MNRKLYVGNLPYQTSETDLTAHFAKAGSVETVNIMRDRETGRARGFGFVEMASETDAQNAIKTLHDQPFAGRPLIVNEARPQPERGFGNARGQGPRRRSEPRW